MSPNCNHCNPHVFHGNFFDSMIQHPEKKKTWVSTCTMNTAVKRCWFWPGIHHPTAPPRPSAKNTHVWCTSGLRTMKNSWCKKVGLVFMAWNHLVAPDMFQTNFLMRSVFFIRFTSLHPKKTKTCFSPFCWFQKITWSNLNPRHKPFLLASSAASGTWPLILQVTAKFSAVSWLKTSQPKQLGGQGLGFGGENIHEGCGEPHNGLYIYSQHDWVEFPPHLPWKSLNKQVFFCIAQVFNWINWIGNTTSWCLFRATSRCYQLNTPLQMWRSKATTCTLPPK